jgi:cytochrome P450
MAAPVSQADFYSDASIIDPLPHYADLRALGDVVWMERHNSFAAVSYEAVVEVLRHPDLYSSGHGISLNDNVNVLLIGSTVNSDGDIHHKRRSITAFPIMPKNLQPLEDFIHTTAEALADKLVAQRTFDAVSEFAQVLPLSIVVDLVGLNDSGREKMLDWAAATFDLMDGFNARSQQAFKTLVGLREYLDKYGRKDALKEGGLARRIFEIAPDSGFTEEEAAQMMRDYIAPSLDTTISATGYAPWLFAEFPDQWDRMREEPEIIPNAVEEIVRLSSPIRAFSRYVTADTELCGVKIPSGARMMVMYGSANRDSKMWDDPDRFDVTRNVRKHVGFGHGVHICMGQHLARREMINLFGAMAKRVKRWELAGEPKKTMNNSINAFASLPVRVIPA